MDYTEKLAEAERMIEEYNAAQETENKIDANEFKKVLVKAGGITDENLRDCSFEDLEGYGITANLLAKSIAKVFRSTGEEAGKKKYVSAKRAEQMRVPELLEVYDPSEFDNPVGAQLIKRSDGKRCIVFGSEGVNVEASAKIFAEIKDKFPERKTYLVGDKPEKVYIVGQRPNMFADENPLYPGRKLFLDGSCDQTSRSWDGVSNTIRTILYLAVKETEELEVSHSTAHSIIDIAISADAEKKIRQRYSNASVMYDELEQQDNLPSLKLDISGSDGSVGGAAGLNNPFPSGNQTY